MLDRVLYGTLAIRVAYASRVGNDAVVLADFGDGDQPFR
jgi:hypothetical protein